MRSAPRARRKVLQRSKKREEAGRGLRPLRSASHGPDASSGRSSLAAHAGGRKAVSDPQGCGSGGRGSALPTCGLLGDPGLRAVGLRGGPAPGGGLGLSRGCLVTGGGARRLPGRLRHPWSPRSSQRTGAWVRGPVVQCGSGTRQRAWGWGGTEFPLLAPRRTAGSHYRPSPFTSAPRAGGSRRPGEGRVIINPRPEIPPEGP